jgi:hypothetical protein
VLCRRDEHGVSRFFVARLSVNGKVRETMLGATDAISIDAAWQGVRRLRREAEAEREAGKERERHRSPRAASARTSLLDHRK